MSKKHNSTGYKTLSQLQEASRRQNQDIRDALKDLEGEKKSDKPALALSDSAIKPPGRNP